MSRRWITRRVMWSAAGLATGVVVGVTLLALSATAGLLGHESRDSVKADGPGLLTATHLPPLLPLAGEPVELRYDVYCDPGDASVEPDAPCDADGTAFVRSGSTGSFRSIQLELDGEASEGRYVARVPAELTDSPAGFQYYTVLRNNSSGQTATVPAGGSAAPQWSHPLTRPITVDLGKRPFDATRRADARVVSASWGSGPGQVGLEGGKQDTPVGGSAFDVDGVGTVTLLDQVNRRALRFAPRRAPVSVPLGISGREADMSVEPNGTIDVLETVGASQPSPILRRFGSGGEMQGSVKIADPFAAGVRVVSGGPVVLEYPSSQWVPAAGGSAPGGRGQGGASSRRSSLVKASPGLTSPGGSEVVVFRTGDEVRVALVSSGLVQRSWRVVSPVPLAEVQLAQQVGDRLALVVRAYTDSDEGFVALVLDGRGVVDQFSLDAADWAETAPLTRFRLVGSSLYRLGSTPDGPFVDRYSLGVS